MAIRFKNILFTAAVVGATTLVTTQVVSNTQDHDTPDMNAMMEAFMKAATPGKEHRMFTKLAGTWKGENTHWMEPGTEPMEFTTIAKLRPIMGGRFMIQEITGTMDMGMGESVFEGMGLFGYDNMKEKHFWAWVDNMGTMMMVAEGTADPSGKVITYFSELLDPMSGGMMEIKSVTRMVNDDKQIFRMHMKMPDGSWFKNMEIVSTRVP